MNATTNPDLDLSISRIIKAPRSTVWLAWADPSRFEKWWIPEPARCKVVAMEMKPGGSLITRISEDGAAFSPHLDACFLAVDKEERIVFTNALTGGWRPAEQPFMTAVITLRDHPEGTDYSARAMHKSPADRAMHAELGFHDGWGTVVAQLARLVEQS